MALYQRRESSGRTRFLLALSLSTVTAIAVAAPLAIEAVNADEVQFAAANPEVAETAEVTDDDLLSGDAPDRTLSAYDSQAKGGIGARAPGKAQAQTLKAEATETTSPSVAPPTADSVLTNPSTSEPAPTTTVAAETTTTTEAEPTTTTVPDSTTTTTTEPTTTTTETTTSTSEADPTTTTTESTTTTTAPTTTTAASTP